MLPFQHPSDSDTLRVVKRVSRAFYISLRILPEEVRHTVNMAYALARTADIIADASISSPENRMKRLNIFHNAVRDRGSLMAVSDVPLHAEFAAELAESERDLLDSVDETLRKLEQLSSMDGSLARSVVTILCEGMKYDIERFASAEPGSPIAISEKELDRYTYQVAGCVGEFWTSALMAHESELDHWDRREQARLGIAYGKGLQMVNILRDVPEDLRLGRCYIPGGMACGSGDESGRPAPALQLAPRAPRASQGDSHGARPLRIGGGLHAVHPAPLLAPAPGDGLAHDHGSRNAGEGGEEPALA